MLGGGAMKLVDKRCLIWHEVVSNMCLSFGNIQWGLYGFLALWKVSELECDFVPLCPS